MLKYLIFALAILIGTPILEAADQVKPLEQILKELPRKYSGRTLDTRLKGKEYSIRILLRSGEVVELVVDGVTGEIKSEKQPGG